MNDRQKRYLSIAAVHAEAAKMHLHRLHAALEYGQLLTEHQKKSVYKMIGETGRIEWDITMAEEGPCLGTTR